jgi:hypothetical protein
MKKTEAEPKKQTNDTQRTQSLPFIYRQKIVAAMIMPRKLFEAKLAFCLNMLSC